MKLFAFYDHFLSAIYIFPKTVYFYTSVIQQQKLAIRLVDFYYHTKFTLNVDFLNFFQDNTVFHNTK